MNPVMRQRLLYGLLAAAIVWAAFNLGSNDQPVQQTTNPPVTQPRMSRSAPAVMPDSDALAEINDADWGIDPFRSIRAARKEKTISWNLKGIIFDPNLPMAYINGRRVKTGDTVSRAKVVRIEKRKVTMEYRGNQFDIFVKES
ncbi:MAG: hypothetical protein V3T31_08170 [candidate division Zixibacteria bacterium]